MKREFIISLTFHFMIITGLFLLAPASDKIEGYPMVYRVGLVSLPSGGRISVGPSGGGGEKSVKASSEKGVAIKELGKGATKSKKKKKEEEAKASLQKDQTKITKKDQEAAEYGLGDGISSAQLDAYNFGSPYYLSIVFGKIRDEWDNPVQSSSNLMATIYFRILRDGNIVETKVEKTSGLDLFDQSAVRAIMGSAPFPRLPNEFSGEYLGIHLEFEYVQ
jgi:outer membrane biosynthesis protein TonB